MSERTPAPRGSGSTQSTESTVAQGGAVDAALDLLLGSRCVGCLRPGRLLCPGCARELPRGGVLVRPDPCPEGLAPSAAAGEYAALLRALVLGHKEHGQLGHVRPLGDLLGLAVRRLLPDEGAVPLLLVPVPSRGAVVRGRGHDPVLRMTRRAARSLGGARRQVRVAPLLRQVVGVRDQAGLTAADRRQNLRGSMTVRPGRLRLVARGHAVVRVVLTDDVLTTGSTAREAQRALEAVGVTVGGIAVVAATRRRVPTTEIS